MRSSPTRTRSRRFEIFLLALGLVAWGASLVALWAGRGLSGLSPIGLRALYGLALVLGWSVGNLYVARTRGELPIVKRILLPLYLLAPAGVLFLVWSTASEEWQLSVPLAPIYASGILGILFLVPVSFARSWRASSKD